MTSISTLHGQADSRRKPAEGRRTGQAALRLALTGDSIVERRLLTLDDATLRPLFDRVRAADVAFTNLEVLANDYRGDPALESGGSHFGAPAWVLDELSEAGFDLFATATNHALDYASRASCIRSRRWRRAGSLRRRRAQSRGCAAARLSHPSARHRGDDLLRLVLRQGPGGGRRSGPTCRAARPQSAALRDGARGDARPSSPLREIADQLGLGAERQQKIKMGFAFAPTDRVGVSVRDGMNFRVGGEGRAVRTHGQHEGHRRHRALGPGGARALRPGAGEPARA